MPRKFRKFRKRVKRRLIAKIPPGLTKKITPKKIRHAPAEFYLSEEDKVVYVYEVYEDGKIAEVVNVSYQIFIKGDWITTLRFDSEHGFLHGHMRISVDNPTEVTFTAGVKRKGDPHAWLTWAVERIKKTHLDYRRGLLKRSKPIDKKK